MSRSSLSPKTRRMLGAEKPSALLSPIYKVKGLEKKKLLKSRIFQFDNELNHLSSDSELTRLLEQTFPQPKARRMDELSLWSVKDVLPTNRKMPIVQANDSVANAIENFASNGIHSAPILDDGKPIAVIDVLDVVNYYCKSFELDKGVADEATCNRLKQESKDLLLQDIVDVKGVNAWNPIDSSASLEDLIRLMCRPNVYRVTVLDEKKNPVGIITPVDVISFLYNHKSELPEALGMRLGESGMQINPVVAQISNLEKVLDAFQVIWEKEVSGEAVSHGSCHLDKLLNWVRRIIAEGISTYEPVTVRVTDTVEDLISHSKNLGYYHRIYLIDGRNKYAGELTFASVLRHFLPKAAGLPLAAPEV